jgi:ketosteroid isomerase-like protein
MKTVSVLLGAATLAICGAQLWGRAGIAPAAKAAIESAAASAADGSMEEQIVAKEREGLEALKAGEPERFGELTADDAVMVDAHGPAGKAQVLKNVAGFRLTEFSMESVQFLQISRDTGLICYKITEKGVSHGHEFAAQAYVSSIWTKRGKKWLCLFSQETGAK